MGNKFVIRDLAADLILIFVSLFFIYKGVRSDQLILSIIGIALLVIGVVRFKILSKALKDNSEE